jgi:hypothetical protein
VRGSHRLPASGSTPSGADELLELEPELELLVIALLLD